MNSEFDVHIECPNCDDTLWLYFIQGVDTGLVKIGKTGDENAYRRLRTLQIGSPDRLLLLKAVQYPRERDMESLVHEWFSDCRVHGEWFEPTDELMDFIDKVGW